MLQLLRDNHSVKKIDLIPAFKADLNWFNVFLHQYNRVTFYDNKMVCGDLYLDARLTGGA